METKTKIVVGIFFIFLGMVSAQKTHAATLSFGPAALHVSVGQSVTVGVYVSSPDQAVNAATGTISFPGDTLEVISISKADSVFHLWVQEPSFSNGEHSAYFEGVVLNPGFQGARGKLLSVQFRAKAPGTALLTFSGSSVLANDGQGSNILTELGSARISIDVPVTTPSAPEASTPAGVPFGPEVRSVTHTDPNRWYSDNDPSFIWELPEGTTGLTSLYNHKPSSNPGTRSEGIASGVTYKEVADGTWYFHLRLRNAQGWGAITHFRFQIDTKPPEPFTISFTEGKETDDPRPHIVLSTTDTPSGIDYYRLKIGDEEAIRLSPEQVNPDTRYELPVVNPGKRTIVVQAFDKAGNVTTATEDITIRPLVPPRITGYAPELGVGTVVKVRGETYPTASVIVRMVNEQETREEHAVQSDAEGVFEIIWPSRLPPGLYYLSAQVENTEGATSEFSTPLTFSVVQRAVLRLGSLVIDYLSVLVSLLSLILLLILMILYIGYRLRRYRERMKKEVAEVEDVLHGSFATLRQELSKQLRILENVQTRRELTEEEAKIVQRLTKLINWKEELIEREVADVAAESKSVLRSPPKRKPPRPPKESL